MNASLASQFRSHFSELWSGNDATDLAYIRSIFAPAAMGVVIHGATASTARPDGYGAITWIGSVEPTHAQDNDIWEDTSA